MNDPHAAEKEAAARAAVAQVESGMVLGLGTGSTTAFAVTAIGERLRAGTLSRIVGVPTSDKTAAQAVSCGIPLSTLREHPIIDLAIDGADEVDPALNLIKGLGGALLREKQVEQAARRFIVIVDEAKLVARLGTRAPVPVEVGQSKWAETAEWLSTLGCTVQLRGGQSAFVTDNGNYVIDGRFANGIVDPTALAAKLDHYDGVLAHGLFLRMANEVIVAGSSGLTTLRRT